MWGGNVPHYSWGIVISERGRTVAPAESSHDLELSGAHVFLEGRTLAPTLENFSLFYEKLCFNFLISLRNHKAPLPRLRA